MLEQNPATEDENQTWTKVLTTKAKTIALVLYGWIKTVIGITLNLLQRLFTEIHAMELLFINMNNIYAFLCQ
ncbi:hypothetical protein ILUMI_16694, partial [Ignelater luminosus]